MFDRMSTYLSWGGNIGTESDDRWQCGLKLALNPSLDGPGLPTVDELRTLLEGPLSTWVTAANTGIAKYASLTWAKCASLDDTGHYTTDEVACGQTAVYGHHEGLSGGPQLAGCVTLWSGSNVGRANYGRFYTPCWNADVDLASGRVTSEWRAGLLGTSKTLVTAVNTWAADVLSGSARVSIMSSVGTGATKRAAYLRVGDVKDTQQRRRRQIPEIYAQETLAA